MRDDRSGGGGTTLRPPLRLILLCSVLALVLSLGLISGSEEEVRSSADGDNSYMDDAAYVTSERCYDCHDDVHEAAVATWHAVAFGNATEDSVVGDWTADPSFELAEGVTVTPVLIKNGSGHFIDLDGDGARVVRVDHVQGAGYWLQAYLTTDGESHYILPIAWATTIEDWVPFHPEEWYDESTGDLKEVDRAWVWDLLCAACHAVGVEASFNSTSGDWMATWEEPGVGCEACHGPGSLHAKPPEGEERVDYIWRTYGSEVCGNCHTGATSVGEVGGKGTGFPLSADGRTVRPGDDLADFFTLAPDLHPDGETAKGQAMQYNDYPNSRHSHSLTTLRGAEDRQDFCLMCHSTDYRLAEEGEEPTLETAVHDIECSLCHGVHGTEHENNLRLDKWETCVQCHRNGDRRPGEEPLPSQKEVVSGTIPIDGLGGDPWMGGMVECTDCHMPTMGVRVVPYDIPSHTWHFISPEKSIGLGMPNSCTVSCHKDGASGGTLSDEEALAYVHKNIAAINSLLTDAEKAVGGAEGALENAEDLGFAQGDIDAANTTYTNSKFALEFVKRDASMVHNPAWQMEILNYSIEKGDEAATALLPGKVQGVIKDADGIGVSGAEIRIDERVWSTTGDGGSFTFIMAPGEHTFDVFKDDDKEARFSAKVTGGEITDVGTVQFEAEDPFDPWMIVVIISLVLVLIIVAAGMEMKRRREMG